MASVNDIIRILRSAKDSFAQAVSRLTLLELQQLVDKADNSYYRPGIDQILEDSEYDLLRPALKVLDPNDLRIDRVGAPYTESELRSKVKHPIPMGSLDNTDDGIAGYEPWLTKTLTKLPEGIADAPKRNVMASLKVDGGSIRASYVDGKLVQVATRGNGEIGEDITMNGMSFQYLPTVLPEPHTIDVRGEAVLYVEDYKKIRERDLNTPFDQIEERDRSNPRNIGNGVFSRDDGQDANAIRFLAFNVEGIPMRYAESEVDKYAFLKSQGFQAVPHKLCQSVDDLLDFYNATADKRDKLPFEIDGIVVCLDKYESQQKFVTKDLKTRLRPKFARAIKFPHKANTTILESVTLSHGHTGGIFPTANLKEVRIGGVNVTHALLNNWDEIDRLGVQLGDEVEVILAGDIIPKVIRVVKPGANRQPIVEPERCPACGDVTTRDLRGKKGAITFCTNSTCPPAMLGKIDHWIGTQKKGVGILGIGDTILKALWDEGVIKDAADLYTMTIIQMQDIELDGGGRIGESRASKIAQETIDKSRMSLSTFLGSLGMDLIGRRRVETLQEAAGGQLDTLEQWMDTETVKTLDVPGLGNTIREAIVYGMNENKVLIEKLISNGVKIEYPEPATEDEDADLPFTGMTFCLTGTRAYTDDIVRLGGVLKSGVSKGLSFLVQKDPTSSSNKTLKAEKYGVKVIGVDFLKKAVDGDVVLQPNGELATPAPAKTSKPKVSKPKQDTPDADELAKELIDG